MKIATVIPTYADCPDLPRCLRYVKAAEDYTRTVEPDWTLFHHVIYGERVGDGRVWSAERDREIARCREAALRWGAAQADWAVLLDADCMLRYDYYTTLVHVLPQAECKTAPTVNCETGRWRFVNERMEGVWELPPTKDGRPALPEVHFASENIAIAKSLMDRIPVPFYRPDHLNEDYELCDAVRAAGAKVYVIPSQVIAT